jgi:hypothetical protein
LLQRGALWGVGRLTHARPLLAKPAGPRLAAFFDSPDAYLRGTAIWAAGAILDEGLRPLIQPHLSDTAPLRLYIHPVIREFTVGELARTALTVGAG